MEAPPGYITFSAEFLPERIELRELQQEAKLVREVIDHPGYAVLQKYLSAVYERGLIELINIPNVMPPDVTQRKIGLLSGVDSHRRVAESVLYAAQEREKAEEQLAQ